MGVLLKGASLQIDMQGFVSAKCDLLSTASNDFHQKLKILGFVTPAWGVHVMCYTMVLLLYRKIDID